jgi:TfoX N-terminal domain
VQVPKPSAEDIARFRSLVPDDPDVQVRPMFGNLGAFVHGNMFMGLLGADIGVKLTAQDAGELHALGGGAFGPPGRPMGGWTQLPAGLAAGPGANDWVALALAHARTLPAKPTARRTRETGGR